MFGNYIDLLCDEQFIRWQLFRTDELERYWADYITRHPEKADDLTQAVEAFRALRATDIVLPDKVKDALFQRISAINRKELFRRRTIRRVRWTAAASIALVAGTLAIFQMMQTAIPVAEPDVFANIDAITGERLPNTEIQLISENRTATLKQDAQITLSEDGQAVVGDTKVALSTTAMNKLIVPPGKRSMLQLSDGTKVWVNSGSEMEFPVAFTGNTRDIRVSGEIYLEVAPDRQKPFFVHTSLFDVKVYGTSFNISAYPDDRQSVVLVEGKVEVNHPKSPATVLLPGTMLDMTPDKADVKQVNVSEYTGWKDGVLVLNETSIADILTKIGRYYNVRFEDNSHLQLSYRTCSGKLLLSDDVEQVVKWLCAVSSTEFYKEDGIIYIKNK